MIRVANFLIEISSFFRFMIQKWIVRGKIYFTTNDRISGFINIDPTNYIVARKISLSVHRI